MTQKMTQQQVDMAFASLGLVVPAVESAEIAEATRFLEEMSLLLNQASVLDNK